MTLSRWAAAAVILSLAGCKPSAADDYVERSRIASQAKGPSAPIVSPNTEGAFWASTSGGDRLVYGKPGQTPLFAIECRPAQLVPTIVYTRYARADANAKAMLALIGNGHVKRVHVDATRIGDTWLWRGSLPASNAAFEVLTGVREVEATIPGAGSLILNTSPLPGQLVDRCAALAPSTSITSQPVAPVETSAPGSQASPG